jgi:hypothetical protein
MGSRVLILALAGLLLSPAGAEAAPKLLHDTFSTAYRAPFGAVPAGTKVTLCLRVSGAKPVAARVGEQVDALPD